MFDDEFTTTYSHNGDLELFKKLGLKPFKAKHAEETYIGEVKNDNGYIKIWVTCCPAQFYKFEIDSKENNKKIVINTGSGCFSEYWDFAYKFLNGQIDFEIPA